MKYLLALIFLLLVTSCNVTFKDSASRPLSEITFVLMEDYYVFHNYAWGEFYLSDTKKPKNPELYSKNFVVIEKGTNNMRFIIYNYDKLYDPSNNLNLLDH